MAARVIVVADAHLGQVPPAVESAFHSFLKAVPDLGDALLINGDLFDFWFEYRAVIPRRHFGTVAKLHALRAQGIPITFVGGNHDRWGGDFLVNAATVRVFRTLHPDLGFWIAHQLSKKLADNTRDKAVLDRAAQAQAQFAHDLLARRSELGLVILAHTHRPALAELPNGRAYLNPGAFLDGGRYAVVTRDSIELKAFH